MKNHKVFRMWVSSRLVEMGRRTEANRPERASCVVGCATSAPLAAEK